MTEKASSAEDVPSDVSGPDLTNLRERLTPMQYRVTQQHATERAFSGRFNRHYEPGVYGCVVCGVDLFSSETKYDSGSGWPSFYDVIRSDLVRLKPDVSHVGSLLAVVANPALQRTEVSCARCGSHLGHVFEDGPPPTGRRHCINSESLVFRPVDVVDGSGDRPLRYFPGSCTKSGSSCSSPRSVSSAK